MKIKIANLKEGLNEINFEHNNDSLDLANLGYIGDSFVNPINVKVNINKSGVQYFLHVIIDTIANFICNRCLERFQQGLHDEFRIVYSMDKEFTTDSKNGDNFRLLTSDYSEIDITTDIRESILLMIPMKIICSEDCLGLCPQCGVNLNIETCNHKSNQIDPRWEALKNL